MVTMGRDKVIAIDFDGTIVEDEYPKIGKIKPKALLTIKRLIRSGNTVVIWTCRDYGVIQPFINKHFKGIEQLKLYVNENPPELKDHYGNDPRKLGADLFIDDKAIFMGDVDWELISKELERLDYIN